MQVALFCLDKPGHLPLRQETRAAHLDYIRETGCVAFGGPLFDATGGMCGSMLVLDVPDIPAAEAWAAGDPYAQAGLFESVTMREWRRVET